MARRIKLTLEYDGTDFNGWQVQAGGEPGDSPPPNPLPQGEGGPVRTVQGVVERALRIVTGQPIRIAGASRTDAGVHARGQVASLLLPDDVAIPTADLCMALNGNMDRDVTALAAEDVPFAFHAQRDTRGKLYSYALLSRRERSALLRRTHWHVRFPLNIERMRQAAPALLGTHDFTSFASKLAETQAQRAEDGQHPLETVKTLTRLDVRADPEFPGRMVIYVEGSGFLYQMVRTIAGSLVDVGRGHRPPEWLAEALTARDRRKAGPTAPAQGLCLEKVMY